MEKLINDLKEKVRNLQECKFKLWNDINNICPNTLNKFGGYGFRISDLDYILDKGLEKEIEGYQEYCINENIEEYKSGEFKNKMENYHKKELEDKEEFSNRDEEYRIKARAKVNNLRKLRLDDLDKLMDIRRANGEEFTHDMKNKYIFLCNQFNYNYNNIYFDNCKRPKIHFNAYSDEIERSLPCNYTCKIYFDCRKITNEKLIKYFKITMEEQRQMKFIISKEEIKRRKNLKRRQDRRDSNGLTKREREKLEKENVIRNLIDSNPNITKSEVARIINLHKSTITRVYGHLF